MKIAVRPLLVGFASVGLFALVAIAADVKLEGVNCVMNPKGPGKAENSVDYKGGKVFFCCMNCPKKFDATKNAVAANHQLVATKQAKQTKCPISGQPIDAEHSVSVKGAEVKFCCPNCKAKVAKATGEDQLKMVFSNEAFEKADFKVAK